MFIKLSVERKAENEALIEYLAEKCEEATQPLNIEYEVKTFIRIRGSNTAFSALTKFLQRYKEKVREITDEGKRVRQLFCLGVKVDEGLMKKLEKNAHVTLDGNRKIVKYESHDGSVTLNGDHSHSSKMKNFAAQKRRSQMAMNGKEEEEEEEPPVPKRSRVSGSSQATSSMTLKPSASKQSGNLNNTPAHQGPASQVTRPSRALNPTGVLSGAQQANQDIAPEQTAPPAPRGNSESSPAGSRQVNPSGNSSSSRLQVRRQSERATGVLSGTQPANQNLAPGHAPVDPIKEEAPEEQNTLEPNDVNIAPGHAPVDPIKVEDPEQQNVFEPNDVKSELQHYQGQQPQRKGILSPAAHRSFINNMQTLISTLKLPIDQRIVSKLEKANESIERILVLGSPNLYEIRIDDFETEIMHTVSVARRNSFDFCAEESRSLQSLLVCLQFSIAGLRMVQLKDLESKLVESTEDPDNLTKKMKNPARFEENQAFIKFIDEKCEMTENPLNLQDTIREFKAMRGGSDTTADAFIATIRVCKKKALEMTDEGKRASRLFALGVKVDEELMKDLEKHAHVTLDRNRKIKKYVSHDGSIVLEGDHSHSSKLKNLADQKRRSWMAMMNNGEEEDDEPEPPAPKRSEVSVQPRVFGRIQLGSSASQAASSNSFSLRPSASKQCSDLNNTPANHWAQGSASQVTRPSRALNPSGLLSGAQQANQNDALGHAPVDPIKVEDPEQQNTLEPIDVKPELQHYQQEQPQRNGILSPAAQENFIHYMLALIAMEKLPIDGNVILKLEEAKRNIKMMGAPLIQIDDFVAEILHTVSIARRSSLDFYAEESRSLRDFLLHLRFSVFNLMMVELEELDTKLKEFIEDPNNMNKRIPINKIDKVMNSILDLLVPN